MKQKNKKKYFYSQEQDAVIVKNIEDDFARRRRERRPYELGWELNMNFYLGNQYSYISAAGEISENEKHYFWENREVFSHIAPIIETRLSKLNKVKPSLTVRPSSSSENDLGSAKLAKSILSSSLEKNSIEALVSSATVWSEITGTAFYKITWDDAFGDTIGNIDGKTIKNGDVRISVCSPFEIYPDSNGSVEVEDCASIIEARACPVQTINSIYGTNLAGSDIDIFELGGSTFLSGMSGRSNVTKIAHATKHDHVLLIEKYEKPTPKNPNGKFTVICGGELLFDGDLPYTNGRDGERTYPFVRQISTKQLSCFWGISVIERCIPLQRSYNAIKNKKHEFIERLSSGVLSVEDGSVDIDNLEDEGLSPGKILVYRNGSTPPKYLESGNIPAELEDEEDRLLAEMNRLACISDVTSNSSIPSGISSGSALTLLVEQDESRLSLVAEQIRISMKKIGSFVLRLYKQFATKPRLEKITDGKGKIEIFYWTNSNLSSDDVVLETSNELESGNSDKKEIALKLLEKGFFDNENGKISTNNKNKLLKLFGFETFEIEKDIFEMHRQRAINENLGLVSLTNPLEIDDHKIHIDEHMKFLISDEALNLENEKIQELIIHISKHKELQKSEE